MLEICHVNKTFNRGTVNEKQALKDLNLTLKDGDFVTIIGGNGAGKSTTLNAIAGVWPVDEGKIVIDGRDVTKLPEYKRAAFLGRVFQDPMNGTVATMGIEENLALALRRGGRRTLKPGITGSERKLYRDLLLKLGLGLEERLTSKVGLLSGGQRQALTLLMATLKKPKRIPYLPHPGFCGSDRRRLPLYGGRCLHRDDACRTECLGGSFMCRSGRDGSRILHRYPSYLYGNPGYSFRYPDPAGPVFH